MIWGYHHLRKPPYGVFGDFSVEGHTHCKALEVERIAKTMSFAGKKKCALSLQVHEYVIYAYSVPRYIYIILYYMNMYNISTSLHKLKVLKKPWTSPKQLYGTTDCRGKKKTSTINSFKCVFFHWPVFLTLFLNHSQSSPWKMTMGIPNVFKMPASFLLIQLWAVAMFCKSWSSPLSSAGKKRDPNGII